MHHRALCKNAGEQGRVSGEEEASHLRFGQSTRPSQRRSEARWAAQRRALCDSGEQQDRVRGEATRDEQCSKPCAMRTSKAESFRDEARPGEECSEPCAMRASEAKSEMKRLARPDEQRSSEPCAMRASESLRGQVRVLLQARLGEQCREPYVMRATRPSKRRSGDRSGAV